MLLLEEAVYTLRRAPLSTWVLHWTGSVPFALALLLFWRDVSAFRASDAACFWDAGVLALALAWMNAWRAAFSARVRDLLTGSPPERFKIGRILANQTFLGAAKLIVLPLALLIIFPLAPVVAFFRYAAALAARPEFDALQAISRAARLARFEQRRSWVVVAALAFVQAAVTVNIAIALMVLPQLFKMLTGIESEFSRGGTGFVRSPLFAMAALAVSWLAFDPFAQAAYCVMCFRAESMETGEDILVALRRLRKRAVAAAAAVAALLFALPARAAAAISTDRLQQAVNAALQSHEYDWRFPANAPQAQRKSWLTAMAEKLLHWLTAAIRWVSHAIGKLIDWIFDRLRGLVPRPNGAAPPEAALHWTVYALLAVIAALVALLAWRLYRTRRKRAQTPTATATVVRLEDETVTPDRLPEEQWLEMAEARLREGDFRLALRAYYLANLAWLGHGGWIAIHPGKTNREYARELRKHARGSPETLDLFGANLAAFERAWYGLRMVEPDDVRAFRERNLRIKTLLAGSRSAEAAA